MQNSVGSQGPRPVFHFFPAARRTEVAHFQVLARLPDGRAVELARARTREIAATLARVVQGMGGVETKIVDLDAEAKSAKAAQQAGLPRSTGRARGQKGLATPVALASDPVGRSAWGSFGHGQFE